MARLLYIQSSPIEDISYSIKAGDAFITEYSDRHPGDEIVRMNLFDIQLPAFDADAVSAKYKILHGKEHSEKDRRIWDGIKQFIEQFKSADKYVITLPMWNFSIPWRLKQYIDILVQPGLTFTYSSEKGYEGLVRNKPLLAIYGRGSAYTKGSESESFDMQTKYIELIFGFIGFTNIRSIVIEPTLQQGPEAAERKLNQAIENLKHTASVF